MNCPYCGMPVEMNTKPTEYECGTAILRSQYATSEQTPSCREIARLKKKIHLMGAMAGNPDKDEALRNIAKLAGEEP